MNTCFQYMCLLLACFQQSILIYNFGCFSGQHGKQLEASWRSWHLRFKRAARKRRKAEKEEKEVLSVSLGEHGQESDGSSTKFNLQSGPGTSKFRLTKLRVRSLSEEVTIPTAMMWQKKTPCSYLKRRWTETKSSSFTCWVWTAGIQSIIAAMCWLVFGFG